MIIGMKRHAEHTHHGIADIFVQHALVIHDRAGHLFQELVQELDDLFRRHLLAEPREAAYVGENDRRVSSLGLALEKVGFVFQFYHSCSWSTL